MLMLLPFSLGLMVCAAHHRRQRNRLAKALRRLGVAIPFGIVVLAALLIAGCGSSNSGSGGGGTTTPVTLTIAGTSGSLSQSTTVTVNIN
jgi:hypothetical protein